jgi:hypothetical protein
MISAFFLCTLILLSIMSLYLVKQIKRNQQDLIKSEEARIEIETLLKIDTEKDDSPTSYPAMRITIGITDPIGLARREQPFTKYLSQITPSLIIKKVYEQVAAEAETGLKERHVDAVINIEMR